MRMNEDLDRIIRYVYNEFGQEFGDIIVDLKHQLKSYKDKEDKLREYIRSYYFEDNFVSIGVMKCCRNEIEEILNDGGKE